MTAPGTRRRIARDLLRSVATLALVLGVTAAALAGVDGLPAWINGEARDVRLAKNLEDAERRVRARLVLPAYFPDTLQWPPQRIRVLAGAPPAVSLVFTARAGKDPVLTITQTLGPGDVPERLLPPVGAIDEARVAVGRTPGTLRRIVGPDGSIWRELTWIHDGRTVVARSKGNLEELIRMARSATVQP